MAASDTSSGKRVSKKIRLAIGDDEEFTEPTFAMNYPTDGRKIDVLRRNPMVPIGAGVTAAVLMAGLLAFNRGSQIWSQRMMRARVVAQGATLGVLALSVYQVKAAGEKQDGLAAILSE